MSSERSDVAVVLLSISYNQIFLFEKSPPLSWFPFSHKECLSVDVIDSWFQYIVKTQFLKTLFAFLDLNGLKRQNVWGFSQLVGVYEKLLALVMKSEQYPV